MTPAHTPARYAVHIPPYDPDRMSDPDYWFDHAEQDLAEAEDQRLEEAFAQIKAGDVQ